jgi:molybdate transport system substrate-binding protein
MQPCLLPAQGAAVSEIQVLSTTAMKTSLDALAADFQRATGHTFVCSFAPSARIAQRVADGEEHDVAVVTAEGAETQTRQGRLVPGSTATIARSAMGLAVQKGARRPDISSGEKFKQTLLAAKSLAMSNPVGGGQSGANLVKIFEKLGITEAMKGKTVYGPGGPAGLIGLFLVRGEVEVGIQQMPELMAVPGIDIIGPLPPDIQSVTVFTAGLSTAAKNADAGRALIQFLTTPAAAKVMREKGFEAG